MIAIVSAAIHSPFCTEVILKIAFASRTCQNSYPIIDKNKQPGSLGNRMPVTKY
jgi:hypothetical protein